MTQRPPSSTLFPYTTLFRSIHTRAGVTCRRLARQPRNRETLSGKSPTPSKGRTTTRRSEEHTSELQSQFHLVCRLLLEKKKKRANPAPMKRRSAPRQPWHLL